MVLGLEVTDCEGSIVSMVVVDLGSPEICLIMQAIVFDSDLKNCDKEEADIFVDILIYLDAI